MKKRDQPTLVYFNKIKTLADTLSSIGEPHRDSEFTGFILQGLDGEYDSLVEAVANNGGMPPRELYNRLLSIEQRVEARRVSDVYTAESFAHAASRGSGGYHPVAPACTPAAPTSGGGQGQPCTPSAASALGNTAPLGCNGRPRSICQLCGIIGHPASRCHKRFNHEFLGIGNDGRNNERQAVMATVQGYTPS
jgi:hypothetical protein